MEWSGWRRAPRRDRRGQVPALWVGAERRQGGVDTLRSGAVYDTQRPHRPQVEDVDFVPQQDDRPAMVYPHALDLRAKVELADTTACLDVPHRELPSGRLLRGGTAAIAALLLPLFLRLSGPWPTNERHQRGPEEHLHCEDRAAIILVQKGARLHAEDRESPQAADGQARSVLVEAQRDDFVGRQQVHHLVEGYGSGCLRDARRQLG
mmetsp:Transcript_51125/g.141612  ORF Transcript_51125/g.141612 Transcript_51125/m.141612 type:complete len:207 (+) Transcript_51125:1166-1786(+)